MNTKGAFFLILAIAAIAFLVLSFHFFTAIMLYISIGLGTLVLLASILLLIRKWQHSGLPVREAKRLETETEYRHEEELARIEIERLDRERKHLLEKAALEAKINLELMQHQLTQHLALTRFPVEQYGMVLVNQENQNLMHIAPIHKPLPQLKPVEAALSGNPTPGPFDMRSIWQEFTPSKNGIFLSKSADSHIIVPANKLLHSVATGPTGGGKTNIVRMLLMQLVYIGCETTLLDIHYAPIKEDEDGKPIDWRPIVNNLAQEPIYDLKAIVKYMEWLAFTELENRIARGRNLQPLGKPIYFAMAELPALLAEAGDEVAQPLAKLLRQGRQFLIYFVGDSQDLLTATLKMTSGPRECFRTGFYTGGDQTTAKALLDLPNGVKLDETGLGKKGLVYLKADDDIYPSYLQGRVGWASNDSLYCLFNTPSYERLDGPARSYHDTGFQTFTRRSETPLDERPQAQYSERLDVQIVDADNTVMEPLQYKKPNVQTFTKTDTVQPVETTDTTSDKRLTALEVEKFIPAYRAAKNIDKALTAIGRGTAYRAHAREIVKLHSL